ncbi:hypothetical protein DPMN_043337 [Dreissena polymorpha]|uniref:Uncharacterized protein n=1 Tax=Dreissena polymorpha TaxID=45954 RepID=A0A9D4HXR3_DREPO|nr:hypothetical protein DPMN_043337 [Dreissena polymorpha]
MDNTEVKKTSVTKAHSFSVQPTIKYNRPQRTSVSDPLLKAQIEQHEAFRRECLSKAIQCNLPDIVERTKPRKRIPLPDGLSDEEIAFIQSRSIRKNNNLRKLLVVLVKKDFVTMTRWVSSNLDECVQQMIQNIYDEFRDEELNTTKFRCLRCRIALVTCVSHEADAFKSAEILSDELYVKVIDTDLKVGAQEIVWNNVFEECACSQSQQRVQCAFLAVFYNLIDKSTGKVKRDYEAIYDDISKLNSDSKDLLLCQCQKLCSSAFHPVSCVKLYTTSNLSHSPNRRSPTSGSPHTFLKETKEPEPLVLSEKQGNQTPAEKHDSEISDLEPMSPQSESSISSESSMSTGSSIYHGSVDMSDKEFGTSTSNRRRAKRTDRHLTSSHNADHANDKRNASLRLIPAMNLEKPSSASTIHQCVSKTRIITKAEDRRRFLEIHNAKSVYVDSSVVRVHDSD